MQIKFGSSKKVVSKTMSAKPDKNRGVPKTNYIESKVKVVDCIGDMEENPDWNNPGTGKVSEMNIMVEESPLMDSTPKGKPTTSYRIDMMYVGDEEADEFKKELRDKGPEAFVFNEVNTTGCTFYKQGDRAMMIKTKGKANTDFYSWNGVKWVNRFNSKQEL